MFNPGYRPTAAPQRLCSRRLLRIHLAAALLAAGGVACGAVAGSSISARQSAPPSGRSGCPAGYADQWPELALGRWVEARRA